LLAGYFLARANARRLGIERRHIDNLTLLVGIAGLAGARIFSWFFFFPSGLSLWHALTHQGGGMVFYGGVVFGIAAVIAYARWYEVELRLLLDLLAAPLALGLAIGRIGCFMAGCCWGDLCVDANAYPPLADPRLRYQVQTLPWLSGDGFPLAVRYPIDCGAWLQHQELNLMPSTATQSLPVHPVQLYEAAAALLLVVWLQRRFQRRAWPGEIACAFCIGYGTIRFVLEFLQAEKARKAIA
jgi:phosphatidylglycerol:prolipoprotein diacylglycerol transferase